MVLGVLISLDLVKVTHHRGANDGLEHTQTHRATERDTETQRDTDRKMEKSKQSTHRFLRYIVQNMNINSNVHIMNTCGIANMKIPNMIIEYSMSKFKC